MFNAQRVPRKLLPYLFVLTLLMFIWQIIFLLFNRPEFFVVGAVLDRLLKVPLYVWGEIFGYWLLQAAFYAGFTLAIWGITKGCAACLRLSWARTWRLGIGVWFSAMSALFLADKILYPNALFASLLETVIPLPAAKILLSLFLILLVAVCIIASKYWVQILMRKIGKIGFLFLISGVVGFFFGHTLQLQVINNKEELLNRAPNVFIIGLDAVRIDRVGFFNPQYVTTPAIDLFLRKATRFSESFTPIARTTPSWVCILTGLYPIHNGIRFNLQSFHGLDFSSSLAAILKKQGYHTVFATDGRRFNVIDEQFGFEQTIGAAIGVDNFLMDLVDGTPMSDLLSNTVFGEKLYPNIFANRDIGITYDPDVFLNKVENNLLKESARPIFLSIHFTLPHYPYLWASTPNAEQKSTSELYDLAIERVDRQLADFLKFLKVNHFLDRAIVVLLSDHGEAFALAGDRMIAVSTYVPGKHSNKQLFKQLNALQPEDRALNLTAGHGTDVLSKTQYRTLLAIRWYGIRHNIPRTITDLVSLLDIKPTILELLHISYAPSDGISLSPYLFEPSFPHRARMLFTEIDFTPVALRAKKVMVQDAIYQSADVFTIEPKTGWVIMKPETVLKLLSTKQRAVYFKNFVLALYPTAQDQLFPVFVDQKTGKWTDDLNSDWVMHTPARDMEHALIDLYGEEVTNHLPKN